MITNRQTFLFMFVFLVSSFLGCKVRKFNEKSSNRSAGQDRDMALELLVPPSGEFQLKDLTQVDVAALMKGAEKSQEIEKMSQNASIGNVSLLAYDENEYLFENTPAGAAKMRTDVLTQLGRALAVDLFSLKPQSEEEFLTAESIAIDAASRVRQQKPTEVTAKPALKLAPYIYEPLDLPNEKGSIGAQQYFRFSWEQTLLPLLKVPVSMKIPKSKKLDAVEFMVEAIDAKTLRLSVDFGGFISPFKGSPLSQFQRPSVVEVGKYWKGVATVGEAKDHFFGVLKRLSVPEGFSGQAQTTLRFSECHMNLKLVAFALTEMKEAAKTVPESEFQSLFSITSKALKRDQLFQSELFEIQPLVGFDLKSGCSAWQLANYILNKSLSYHSSLPKAPKKGTLRQAGYEALKQQDGRKLLEELPSLGLAVSAAVARIGNTNKAVPLTLSYRANMYKGKTFAGEIKMQEFSAKAFWNPEQQMWLVPQSELISSDESEETGSEGVVLQTFITSPLDSDFNLEHSYKIAKQLLD